MIQVLHKGCLLQQTAGSPSEFFTFGLKRGVFLLMSPSYCLLQQTLFSNIVQDDKCLLQQTDLLNASVFCFSQCLL